ADRLLERLDALVVGAPHDVDPATGEVVEQGVECSPRPRVQDGPARGLHDRDPPRRDHRLLVAREEEPGAAWVTAGADRDLRRDVPEVLHRRREDTDVILAQLEVLTAVDRAERGLDRERAAETGRTDHGTTDLRAERGRDHACTDRGRGAARGSTRA